VSSRVVLVSGLWMPSAAMSLLAARLGRRGYSTRVFAYRGRAPLEPNVERLARLARDGLGGGPAYFVGHSLGGLLILEMLRRYREIAAAGVVLIGSPVRGCYAGRRLALSAIGRWMMGASGPLWEERDAAWARAEPLGVIAGTRALGLGRVLGPLPGASDGVVRVSETRVEGMRAQALVGLGHSALIFSPRVAALVARFLAEGRFE
jgi:pimeloyl-ACP methyl ester carboxylesterase